MFHHSEYLVPSHSRLLTTDTLPENGSAGPLDICHQLTQEGPSETIANRPGAGAPFNFPPIPNGPPTDPLLEDPAPTGRPETSSTTNDYVPVKPILNTKETIVTTRFYMILLFLSVLLLSLLLLLS